MTTSILRSAPAVQDALFDLADLARQAVAATPWHGVPLAYTTDYYTPAQLREAFNRYRDEFGNFACIPRSHMWHGSAVDHDFTLGAHGYVHLVADTRCTEPDHDHSTDPLPHALMYQTICEPCSWHHISASENEVVEAWHDHALPTWRTLPVMPAKLRSDDPKMKPRRLDWIAENYPADAQIPGAPILAHRTGRHVSHRSPLGGYELAVTIDGTTR